MVVSENIDIVIIAVPAASAQAVCDEVVAGGIKAILNFAPINLKVPDDVVLRNQNMCIELEHLAFALNNKNR
jgi:redox-sensing transcriptional repressor